MKVCKGKLEQIDLALLAQHVYNIFFKYIHTIVVFVKYLYMSGDQSSPEMYKISEMDC